MRACWWSHPSDFLSVSPVAGAKAQSFIERTCTSSPTKVVALFALVLRAVGQAKGNLF